MFVFRCSDGESDQDESNIRLILRDSSGISSPWISIVETSPVNYFCLVAYNVLLDLHNTRKNLQMFTICLSYVGNKSSEKRNLNADLILYNTLSLNLDTLIIGHVHNKMFRHEL